MPREYHRQPYVPARDPLAAIPPSRHPFQFWVMFGLILSGASNFFIPGSEVLRQGLDPFSHKVWAGTLMIGAIVTLISAWWKDRITGLLLERIGLVSIGISCPVYAAIVLTQVPGIATSAIVMATVGIASIWRAVHVTRELRVLRAFMARNY